MSEVTAVISKKYLHFHYFNGESKEGGGGIHLGQARCYDKNRWKDLIAILLTKIFGYGIVVSVGGDKYYLDRKSFNRHLSEKGIEALSDRVNCIGYEELITPHLESLKITAAPAQPFYKHLFPNDVERMTKEMVRAMRGGDREKVKELLLRGSDFNRCFYAPLEGKSGRNFSFSPEKFSQNREGYVKYSPLAWAVKEGDQELASLIYRLKGEKLTLDDKFVEMSYVEATKESNEHYSSTAEAGDNFVVKNEGEFTFGSLSDRFKQPPPTPTHPASL